MNQTTALSILKTGANVFLTGSAGTGKTYVLNQYIEYLRTHDVKVAVTASTGIAATHLNGMTIHSWSGIGIKDRVTPADIKHLATKQYLVRNIRKASVLIIDEISMLHRFQLDAVDQVLQKIRQDNSPFGGIQLVVSGDFFQLPPVGAAGQTNEDKYAFMADAWREARLKICYLTEQHRQSNRELTSILNGIRNANTSSQERALLRSRMEISNMSADITKLYTHNVDVDRINDKHLAELPGMIASFRASTKGNPKLVESLKRSVLTREHLQLKKGAQVMFVRNNFEQGYMNGTVGTIKDFGDDGEPIVQTTDGRELVAFEETWSIEDANQKTLAAFTQVPLRLAWAITVHKSQGMTLERASIDLTKTFEKGQGYVALSRLTSLEGMYLEGFNDVALEVDELVLRIDDRMQELSEQAADVFKNEPMEELATQFIFKSGGTLDPVPASKRRNKKKKATGPSTYELTRDCVALGLSIEEIAHERGLNQGTIVTHIQKIRELFPDTDLSYLTPDNDMLEKVDAIYKQVATNAGKESYDMKGRLKLKELHTALEGKLAYDDIKLALAFIDVE